MTLAAKGIDVRQTSGQIVFEASLKDSTGAKVTTGTTSMRIFGEQSDGTLRQYDFATDVFLAAQSTDPSSNADGSAFRNLTHRAMGTSTAWNTGIWSYALSTLTGFTVGGMYIVQITNSGATPESQERKFQFGGQQGDLVAPTAAGYQKSDVEQWLGATAPAMTGDAYARIGAAGAGLTAIGDTRLANLDTKVSDTVFATELEITNSPITVPALTGTYTYDGVYNNYPSYKRADSAYYIWWSTYYRISTVKGTDGTNYWVQATNTKPWNAAFAPQSPAIGAPVPQLRAIGARDSVGAALATDSTVSKPGTAQTIAAPYTVGQIATAVWSVVIADLTALGSTTIGKVLQVFLAGVTSLAQWLGLIAGKQTGNSTARTELRATGAGSGTFDETTDSMEAIRDRGDAAWITGAATSTLTTGDIDARLAAWGKTGFSANATNMPADGDFLNTTQKLLLGGSWYSAPSGWATSQNVSDASSKGESATQAAALAAHGDLHWTTATATNASNMPSDGNFLSAAQKASLTAAGSGSWYAAPGGWATPTNVTDARDYLADASHYNHAFAAGVLVNAPTLSLTDEQITAIAEDVAAGISIPTKVQIREEMDANSTKLLAIKAKTDLLTTSIYVSISSPVLQSGRHLSLVVGDTYNTASGQAIVFFDPGNWPAGIETAFLKIYAPRTGALELTGPGGAGADGVEVETLSAGVSATFFLTKDQTDALHRGHGKFDLVLILDAMNEVVVTVVKNGDTHIQ